MRHVTKELIITMEIKNICSANQGSGFCMITASVMKELKDRKNLHFTGISVQEYKVSRIYS